MTAPQQLDVAGSAAAVPPRPPFAFRLGVTGHRSGSLGPGAQTVTDRIADAVRDITSAALDQYSSNRGWYSQSPPQLLMVSPLADGADQIAANAALANGYALHVVLPFTRKQTCAEVAEPFRGEFDRLADAAGCLLELPGNPADPLEAYVMAGRATLAHCDVLIAVWDGQVPRGRGGTGEVVELAMARGIPIIHIPVDPDKPVTLLWSAYDPAVLTLHSDDIDRRPFDGKHLAELVSLLLSPPVDERERGYLTTYFSERPRRFRARVEYPLLLATAGISRFGAKDFQATSAAATREEEWRRYRESCAERHGVSLHLDLLGEAHRWSGGLATYFAQNYRSGHVLNFVLAALAVIMGLAGFLLPASKLELAALEFVLALIIILNTRFGVRHEWHRRWLDYRQLAERLRPLRSLKLLGLASPDPPGSAANPTPRRWVEWYAASIWRASGCLSGKIIADAVPALAQSIAAHEVDPQVAYHRAHSRQIMLLDHRLEMISAGAFWTTLLASAGTIAALVWAPDLVDRWGHWLTLVSAGLPTIGAAVFGIRFQGDFGGSALRSDATAASLGRLGEELRAEGISLMRAADLGEQAARAMLADLAEWRLVNQQHDLSITG
ncbi:MAG TPA: hypothetical protein VL336_01095 [Sphingomicrobium sp.]|nr:hypothetical protein [Sphingomicrobium sp.]